MSLILEALRKSEIERRRAQAPDLYAEPALATRPPLVAPPRWLAWVLAAVAAVLLVGWLARGLWSTPSPPVAVAASARVAPATQPRGPTPTPALAHAHTSAEAAVAAPAAARARATAPQIPPAPIAPPPIRTVEEPAASGHRSVPSVNLATATPISAPMPAPMPSPAATATSTPTLTSEVPLRLADLSSEERRQLPTLKMSMHLWDAASAQRFVILDGERMGEGDRVGDAVIDEITRDGVVLAWQGRRLKLPIQ